MPKQCDTSILLNGRYFTEQELADIQEIVRLFPKLSRWELVRTICENLEWFTATGQNKVESCNQLLEKLEQQGLVTLPSKRKIKKPTQEEIIFGSYTEPDELFDGNVTDLEPIGLEPVRSREKMRLWNEYVHRYHSLGYKRPFGAHQRYFIVTETMQKPLGCLLFSAAAWALKPRDEWIGWPKEDRSLRLNLVLNNSRFVIFPWFRVNNLASKVLSLATKRIVGDWQERYGFRPVLLETFVDSEKYQGTCYKAGNWLYLGRTAGRGRMDKYNQKALTPKDIYVYPLCNNFRSVLRGEVEGHE